MKILKFAGLSIIILTIGLLITANIFHRSLRKQLDPAFAPLEVVPSGRANFGKVSNAHYLFEVTSDRKSYSAYQGILIYARIFNKDKQTIPANAKVEVSFSKKDKPVFNIKNQDKIYLKYQKKDQVWVGHWFPLDHRENGTIRIKAKAFLTSPEEPLEAQNNFFVNSKNQNIPLQKGLSFLCIDSKERISRRTIISTEGKEVNWNAIPNWIQFIDADGILMLGGITKTFEENASFNNPWEKDKINESITLSEKLKKDHKKFGVWIKALELEGTYLEKMGYNPTLKFSTTGITKSKNFISLQDENRKKSLTKLLDHFASVDSIQYIGLSKLFSKNQSGIEMLEDFVNETQVPLPKNWKDLSPKEKIEHFQQNMNQQNFSKAFSRWKYYKMAAYIRDILPKKHDKPVFYSTDFAELSEHPDLISIVFSAGVDFVVLNLNPKAGDLFKTMNKLKKVAGIDQYYSRMLISYELDYKKMHKDSYQISAIQNFNIINNNLEKFSSLYPNIQGLAIRDFYRAMFGKRGPYSPFEWMLGISKSIHLYKNQTRSYPIQVSPFIPLTTTNGQSMPIHLRLLNQGTNTLYNLKISLLPMMGKFQLQAEPKTIDTIHAGEEIEVSLSIHIDLPDSQFVRKRQFLGYHISWSDKKSKQATSKYKFTDYESFILQGKETKQNQTNQNEEITGNKNVSSD